MSRTCNKSNCPNNSTSSDWVQLLTPYLTDTSKCVGFKTHLTPKEEILQKNTFVEKCDRILTTYL